MGGATVASILFEPFLWYPVSFFRLLGGGADCQNSLPRQLFWRRRSRRAPNLAQQNQARRARCCENCIAVGIRSQGAGLVSGDGSANAIPKWAQFWQKMSPHTQKIGNIMTKTAKMSPFGCSDRLMYLVRSMCTLTRPVSPDP